MAEQTEAPVEEERIDPFSLFPEQIRIPVRGLGLVGHIQRDIYFCGHTFTLKTLRPAEKAAAAIAAQPYRETIAEPEVWANAQVGMALVAVDDDPDFCPAIGPNIHEFAKARLRYVTDAAHGWFTPTLGFLYEHLLSLEDEARFAIQELQNLSERNRESSQPLLDSLIAQGTSDEPTNGDTPA